jgi:ferritin
LQEQISFLSHRKHTQILIDVSLFTINYIKVFQASFMGEKLKMVKEKMVEALNEQINAELYSAYLYLSMSAYFEDVNLTGFSNWMRVQSQEELNHAMKIYDFVVELGERVELFTVQKPPKEWESPLAAFEAAYKHEQHVTGLINNLVDMAIADKDHATNNMLQWFVAEQVEEEASANEIVQKLRLVGEEGRGLLILDRELAQRKPGGD